MVCIEVSDNIGHGITAGIHFKDFSHNRSRVRVNLEVFFSVHAKTKRHISARGQTFFSIDIHAPANLLRKFDAIIFCHSF